MSGKPAARVGDAVSDGVIVSGSSTVLIGDAAEGKADQCPTCEPAVGAPVNPLLGAKLLPAETDFALAAPRPFAFTRSYLSSDARVGCLGQGWSIPGEGLGLEADDARTVLIDAQGRRIAFGPLAPGEARFSASERLWIRRAGGEGQGGGDWAGRWSLVPEDKRRDPAAIFVLAGRDGLQFEPRAGRLRLTAQLDRNGYRTDYGWSERGQLSRIRDSAGRMYQLVYHRWAEPEPTDCGLRLSGVALLAPAGHEGAPPRFDPDHPATDWLVRYDYDDDGNLAAVVDRTGETVRSFRWRNHLLIAHGAPGGIEVSYEWDQYGPHGKVLAQREADGLARTYRYHPDHTEVTDSLARTERYHFEGEGGDRRWTVHERADGSRISYRYDWAGRRVAVTDPLGRTRRTRLDGEGRTIGTSAPDGSSWRYRLDDGSGEPIEVSAPGRLVWRIDRDARANPLRVTAPDGGRTAYAYGDPALPDRPTEIIDARGGVRRLEWNALGQLVRYTDCSGQSTAYAYDGEGRLVSERNARGETQRFEHDRLGRVTANERPDGSRIAYYYDALGRLIRVERPGGNIETLTWDRLGRLVGFRDAGGLIRKFRHDAAGRLVELQNENEAVSCFEYDVLDRVVCETGFDGRTQRYGYNAAGELTTRTEIGLGQQRVIRYEHDTVGRLTARHLPATEHAPAFTERFSWRTDGQLEGFTSPAADVRFAFDLAGRLACEYQRHLGEDAHAGSGNWTYTVNHRRGPLGHVEASAYGTAPSIEWLHYGSGHLHGVRLPGLALDFERDELHREIERIVRPAPNTTPIVVEERDYTPLGLLARSRVDPAVGAARVRQYRCDAQALLVAIADSSQLAGGIRYTYDASGRLVASRHGAAVHTYRFDSAGNRLDPDATAPGANGVSAEDWTRTVQRRIGEPGFNPLSDETGAGARAPGPNRWQDNRITELAGARSVFDGAGNLVERVTAEGARLAFGYDGAHRLVRFVRTNPDGRQTKAIYRYDALSRRIAKIVTGPDGQSETIRYGWDGERLVCEATRATTTTVAYEPNSFVPLLRIEQANAPAADQEQDRKSEGLEHVTRLLIAHGVAPPEGLKPDTPDARVSVFLTDHLGTPLLLVDQDGQHRWTAEPDDWAAVRDEQGIRQPIRFQGQWLDEESGLYYNRHRYYDPSQGRYVTQDPIGLTGGANLYGYVANPTGTIDPLGLSDVLGGRQAARDNAGKIIRPGGAEIVIKSPVDLPPGVPDSKSTGIGIGEGCKDEEIGIGGGLVEKAFKKVKDFLGIGDGLDVSADIACVDPGAAVRTATGEIVHQVENTGVGQVLSNRGRQIDAIVDGAR